MQRNNFYFTMRRRNTKKQKGYFYEKEENAIIDYILATDEIKKNTIFNTILYPALTQMIESIIRRYKLYVPDEEFEQTFNDTFSYLLTKIENFNPEKGCKAYSYCGTVCKNYLFFKCSQYTKNLTRNSSYDSMAEELNQIEYTPYERTNNEFAGEMINAIIIEIEKKLNDEFTSLSDSEIKVGKALLNLLNNWEKILNESGSKKLQKSNILYFLREETMMTTKEIRDNMKQYKNIYKFLKNKILS